MNEGNLPPIGQPIQPANTLGQSASGMPMVQQVQLAPVKKKDVSGLVKTVVIIILSLIAATFIGLFIWIFMQYDEERTFNEERTAEAVATAQDEQSAKDARICQEEKDYPYKVFAGPDDYGALSFEYPKTWSVYVASDASKGGEFTAYLNPDVVGPVEQGSVYALRVRILDKSFDSVSSTYQNALKDKKRILNVKSVTVNGDIVADLYYGVIPSTELNGYILIFRIRDKTAIIQTDSGLFREQFEKLIETLSFNA